MTVMDIDVVINSRARRGSASVAREVRHQLPEASLFTSHSLDEAASFARARDAGRRSLLVSAGGDGTAVGLLNSLRGDLASPVNLAVLPLGTGNALAHDTGAPNWRTALRNLAGALRRQGPLPMRRFNLLEVRSSEGGPSLAHFAGTGWDAEIIDDFYGQKTGLGVLPKSMRQGLAGYFQGVFTRTIPRHLFRNPDEVELINTGEDALTVDENGQAVRVPGGGHGAVLYRGPANVCAGSTTSSWGFGLRAFPFADLVPGRFCMRVYAGTALEAASRMRQIWKGAHPIPNMHTWLLTSCRAVYRRPAAFQIGGDRHGHVSSVEYRLAEELVDLLEWRGIRA
jgi:hypothetical protein